MWGNESLLSSHCYWDREKRCHGLPLCSSGVPHFSKYRLKKSNCRGEGEEAATFQYKLKGIAHIPRHVHRFLAGIPGLERRGLSRVGARIGCKDGFVLGDFLFESCLRLPLTTTCFYSKQEKPLGRNTTNQARF